MKKATLICLLGLSLFLSGCMGKTNLNERAVVSAVGVDFKDGEYEIALEIFDGKGQDEGQSAEKAKVITARGRSVSEAVENAGISLGRSVFLGQNRVVLIGKGLAERGVSGVLTYFDEGGVTLKSSPVAVTDGTAVGLLNKAQAVGVTSEKLLEILENCEKNGIAPNVLIYEFERDSYFPFDSAVMPIVSLQGGDERDEVTVSGSAVFKGQKMVCDLSREETRGYLWISGKIRKTAIQLPLGEESTALGIERARVKISPEFSGGSQRFRVEIRAEATKKAPNRADLQRLCEAEIEKECRAATERALFQNGADIFGLSRKIWRKTPDEFRKIRGREAEALSEAEFLFEVKVRIK